MSLSRILSLCSSANRRRKTSAGRRRSNSLRAVERLEERAMLMAIAVTNLDPSGPGSLAAAVSQSNDQMTNPGHDTINFAKGLHGTIEIDSTLVIVDDLSIRGPGAHKLTISGGDLTRVRVFSVLSSDLADPITVDIHRVTIANGLALDAPGFPPEFAFGGGLYNAGSNVTLNRVRMEGNQAIGGLGAGGAVANEVGGSLTVKNSHLVNNAASGFVIGAGGAISSDIGPTEDGEGTPGQPVVRISHSHFKGNVATAMVADPSAAPGFEPFAGFAFGGAFTNLAGDATVKHSSFEDNHVIGGNGAGGNPGGLANGGAIYSDDFSPFDAVGLPGRDASLKVSHSRFVNNSSTGGTGDTGARGGVAAGGAISVSISFWEDSANIRHSVFKHNTATGGAGGAGGGAGGPAVGGALSVLAGADVLVARSHFSHNTAQGGAGASGGNGGDGTGGAIGLGRIVTAVPFPFLEDLLPTIAVRGSTIGHNAARGGEGGAAANGGNGNGGGLGVTAGSTASVAKSLIVHNRAVGGSGGTGGDGGNGQGGGVSNSGGSSTTLTRSIVFRNYAKAGDAGDGGSDGLGLGGGIFNDDDLLSTLVADRLLTRCNHADDAGHNVFGDLS